METMARLTRAVGTICRPMLLLAALLVAAIPSLHAQGTPSASRVVRVSLVEGTVQVQRAGEPEWQTAPVNLPLEQGDTLATGTGRAEVEFENGALAHLDANSVLQFTLLDFDSGGRTTRLTLTQGTGRFYARPAMADVFQVFAPGVQVSFRDLAEFRVDTDAEGTSVAVTEGAVLVTSESLTRQVHKNQMLSFLFEDQNVTLTGPPHEDEFDEWVVQRTQVVSSGTSAVLKYLNSQQNYVNSQPNYGYGLADLYDYGSWQFYSGFGWGWQPHGIGVGWWPFTNGAWSFSPALGYFWISNEPWGWMPYHFGRWLYAPQGWLWIPGQFDRWEPAVATWVRIGNDFGWVPLAPQDRPNRPPANLRWGVLVNQQTGITNVQAVPQPGTYNTMRIPHATGAQVITQPPASMARQLAPPLSRAVPFTGRTGIAYDGATHTYVNANSDSAAPTRPGWSAPPSPSIRTISPPLTGPQEPAGRNPMPPRSQQPNPLQPAPSVYLPQRSEPLSAPAARPNFQRAPNPESAPQKPQWQVQGPPQPVSPPAPAQPQGRPAQPGGEGGQPAHGSAPASASRASGKAN
jgi:hypothetical protein